MTVPPADRPLRRDAAHNRDRLLAAAGEVFDAQGLDASVAEVARVAGVGMGTLYRRFPTKDALIDALVQEVLGDTVRMAGEALEHQDGTGLEWFLEVSSAHQAEHRGCLPRLWSSDHELVSTARRLIAELLWDAQRHGRIRRDLTSTDLTMVMWSIRGVLMTTLSVSSEAWRRHLDLLVAGMRPTPENLPHPALTREQLEAILIRTEPAAEGAPAGAESEPAWRPRRVVS
jgi:AcrR family transcriptional regulator